MAKPAKRLVHCAPEAEQAAIGCLLRDPEIAWQAFDKSGVNQRWFYDLRMAAIFNICRDLRTQGKAIDPITIITRAEQIGTAKIDLGLLTTLPDTAESVHQVESYLAGVQSAFQKRGATQAAQQILRSLEAPETESGAALAGVESIVRFYQGGQDNDLPQIVSATDFMASELPDAPEAIGGILHKGSKIVVSGASKAGKTWLFIDLGTSVAVGAEWLGLPTGKGRVLYLNTELSPRTFQKRLRYVCTAKGIPVENLGNLDLWHLRGKTSPWNIIIPKIRARVKEAGYTLIIVDPLYRLYGALKENSAEDMGILTNALGELAEESGAAVAIATHHSKGNQSSKEAIDRISGSGVIARDADALMDFSANEVEDAYSVSLRLRDFKPMPDFGIRWQFPLFHRDENVDPARLKQIAGRPRTANPVKLLEAIETRTVENPVSISEWAHLSGIKRPTLSEYLPDFRRKGWIQTVGEGSKSRQVITKVGLEYLAANRGAK
jgi:hypothetical protein